MTQRSVPEEIFLRVRQEILKVWVIWVLCNMPRISLHSVLVGTDEAHGSLLAWLCRPHHVEAHEPIIAHAPNIPAEITQQDKVRQGACTQCSAKARTNRWSGISASRQGRSSGFPRNTCFYKIKEKQHNTLLISHPY